MHPVVQAQTLLDQVRQKGATKGMIVNSTKTSLLCSITAASSYEAAAEIRDNEGGKIVSRKTVKYLGVSINSDCSFRTHVEQVRKRIRSRAWALNTLDQNGFTTEELISVYYCTYITRLDQPRNMPRSRGTLWSRLNSLKCLGGSKVKLLNTYHMGRDLN